MHLQVTATTPARPAAARLRLVALLAVVVLAGCAPDAAPGAPPTHDVAPLHRQWIDEEVARTDSALLREILADHWVSDEELAQAQDDYRQCLEDWPTPIEVTFQDDGTVIGPTPEDPEEQAAFDEFTQGCSSRAFDSVDMYHRHLRTNPEGLTYAQAVRRCFDEHEVPDGAGLSEKEFEEMLQGPDGETAYEPSTQAGLECLRSPYSGARA